MQWLAEQLESGSADVLDVLGSLAATLAERNDCPVTCIDPALQVAKRRSITVPDHLGVDVLAAAHEWLAESGERHDRGMHYTPAALADRLTDMAFRDWSGPATVCDPTAGGGTFLLAAARSLATAGQDRQRVAAGLHGADIDPLAAAVARTSIALWAGVPATEIDVVCADSLLDDPWPDVRFDWVVGNPPFLSQLGRGTARKRDSIDRLKARFGAASSAYTDTAALFLRAAVSWAGDDGRVLMVQPLSVLATRDTSAVRSEIAELASVNALWVATNAFEAAVNVCALVLATGEKQGAVSRFSGVDFESHGAAPPLADPANWAQLAAAAVGLPEMAALHTLGAVGDLGAATAGFRDEYYAIVEVIEEGKADDGLKVMPVGSIDPLVSHWGSRPARIGGTKWKQPIVRQLDIEAVSARVGAWVQRLSVPKLLVATQSATLEVVVDEIGSMVPLTPVVALTCDPDRLWHVAAALLAPPITALAATNSVGAARSVNALKLAAREIALLPLPANASAWDDGARYARRAALAGGFEDWADAMAGLRSSMTTAYGVDDPAFDNWFCDRVRTTDERVRRLLTG